MNPSVAADSGLAVRQWVRLRSIVEDLGHTVHLGDPVPGLPDMVYAANAGLVIDGKALVARFAHAERAPEGTSTRLGSKAWAWTCSERCR
jgi:ornithine--oxo-acid transaminase